MMVSIFIVDDDENLHRVYRSFFSMKGFDVIGSAFDGAEAVKMFSSLNPRPDVLLMDYRMPIKDGVSATREIRTMDPASKIIFLSADETAREHALKAGAISFLIKPVRFAQLLQTITQVLDNQ
jgi:two-component system chemotaxis response regulator CheY